MMSVLNALRHHGHRYSRGCALRAGWARGAQRLAASRPSLLGDARAGGAARGGVLNALRHHGHRYRAPTRSRSKSRCAQRLAASRPSLLAARVHRRPQHEVLNALRHHGHRYSVTEHLRGVLRPVLNALRHHGHRYPCGRCSAVHVASCAQRLAASRPSLPPCQKRLRRALRVLNALRHHGHRYLRTQRGVR